MRINEDPQQWVAIFIDYAKRHPKRYQEPFAFRHAGRTSGGVPVYPEMNHHRTNISGWMHQREKSTFHHQLER